MAVRIVTDSSADLPSDLAQRWNITVIPCYVVIGDQSHRDGVDISPEDFYQGLVSNSQLPTTAQPSAADFQAMYQALLDQGHDIVSIHISRKLSGTLNSAEQARAALGDAAANRIEIIDSQLASIPLGLVALSAGQLAAGSDSHRQVAAQVNRDLPLTHGYFVLDTLTFLQKGGRIGKAQAFVGSVLNVKPILTIRDGEAHPVERPRNRDRALRRLVDLVQQLAPVKQLAVIYSTEKDQAEALKIKLSGSLPPETMVVTRFGPTLGTYIGPKALGVALTQAGDILKS